MNKIVKKYARSVVALVLLGSSSTAMSMQWAKSWGQWANRSAQRTVRRMATSAAGWAFAQDNPHELRAENARVRAELSLGQQEYVNRELIDAVRTNNRNMIDARLEGGAFINAVDHNGRTPLLIAVTDIPGDNPELIERLILYRADLDAQNAERKTPLMLAIEGVKPNIVRTLVAAGANLEMQDNQRETALMKVARLPYTTPQQQDTAIQMAHVLLDNGARVPVRIYTGFKERFNHLLRTHAGVIGAAGVSLAVIMLMCKSYAVLNPLFWTFIVAGYLGTTTKLAQARGVIAQNVLNGAPVWLNNAIGRFFVTEEVEERRARTERMLRELRRFINERAVPA